MAVTAQDIIEALMALQNAFLAGVKAGGKHGVPEGHLYAGLMGIISLTQFNNMVAANVAAGKIRKVGYLLYLIEPEVIEDAVKS